MISDISWTTQKRKLSDLIPVSYNPRKLSPKQAADLKKSLVKFNLAELPVINADSTILAGHQRCKILADIEGKDFEIEVRVPNRQLNKEEADEYLIRSNKNSGEFDFDLLEEHFEFDDLIEFGFDEDELNFTMEADFEEVDSEGEDDAPEPVENPTSKLGDVWKLGDHRLMCGDSTSIEAVEKLMDGNKADMVFTDPPYGVSYKNNMNNNHTVIKNDDVFLDFLPVLRIVSRKNSHWYIWTSDPVYDQWREAFKEFFKSTVIWYKGGGSIGDLKGDFARNYEFCLFCQNGRMELIGSRDGAVWEFRKDSGGDYVHPTQKPVALSEYAITKSSYNDESVLDLFGGSGSTLIACEKTKRKCFMMEFDEKYSDVIIKRWQEFTGKEAIHKNGKTYTELSQERGD